ncbi:MAG: hypothetical protein U0514_00315 [Candidatus Andersenbacteria bacterium]
MAEENALEFGHARPSSSGVDEAGTRVALKLSARQGARPAARPRGAQSPERVEIYDISSIRGVGRGFDEVVLQGKPSKADYRRFKIATRRANDVGMMKEVLRRRLASGRERSALAAARPDHRGRWQAAARRGPRNSQGARPRPAGRRPAAKREEELFVPGRKAASIRLPRGTAALHLVQRMRDEAHRFAITFHRQLRGARTRRSVLDEVVGISPKRKKLLLERYGSIEALADAGETELGKLIGARTAAALLQQLR